jgi:hypothetical protein
VPPAIDDESRSVGPTMTDEAADESSKHAAALSKLRREIWLLAHVGAFAIK